MNEMLFDANHVSGLDAPAIARPEKRMVAGSAASARKPFLARIEDFSNARFDDKFWKNFEDTSRHLSIW